MPVKGLKEVLNRFDIVIEAFENWKDEQVEKATLKLHEEVKTMASVEDQHTLAVLREMGHPYAVRHVVGPQGPRQAPVPHEPQQLIHVQTGQLLAAIKDPKIFKNKEVSIGTVEIDESQSPHARWVIFGTSKMISRNFPVKALENIRDDWWELLKLTGKDLVRSLKK